ncbi:MAG TPA: DUF72 domain-containing protein [Chitinophagaceae bacterium]|nr:DUF72 domain-containing protein [Chitinophagaceae bacterium]
MLKNIYIGTSGWSYKDWKGLFYPPELKSTEWLTFFSNTFKITEINSSFYHLPLKKTVTGWVNKVPADFKFCPKISRYLTHIKRLKDAEEPLERFFSVFSPMKDKMGPVLVQLPPSLKFDSGLAQEFYKILHSKYNDYSFALEARHESWLQKDSLKLMGDYDIAFVVAQSGKGFPYAEVVTAKNIYVRFHGPKELYASSYSDSMLADFAGRFKKWHKAGHIIWAFFNNDYYGYAINNGLKLINMLQAG